MSLVSSIAGPFSLYSVNLQLLLGCNPTNFISVMSSILWIPAFIAQLSRLRHLRVSRTFFKNPRSSSVISSRLSSELRGCNGSVWLILSRKNIRTNQNWFVWFGLVWFGFLYFFTTKPNRWSLVWFGSGVRVPY